MWIRATNIPIIDLKVEETFEKHTRRYKANSTLKYLESPGKGALHANPLRGAKKVCRLHCFFKLP